MWNCAGKMTHLQSQNLDSTNGKQITRLKLTDILASYKQQRKCQSLWEVTWDREGLPQK